MSLFSDFLFSVEIMVVQDIREIQQILKLKFSLRLTWVDARFLILSLSLSFSLSLLLSLDLGRRQTGVLQHQSQRDEEHHLHR